MLSLAYLGVLAGPGCDHGGDVGSARRLADAGQLDRLPRACRCSGVALSTLWLGRTLDAGARRPARSSFLLGIAIVARGGAGRG